MDINSIQLSQLTGIKNIAKNYSNFEDDYIFTRLTFDAVQSKSGHKPVRINGFTMILCLEGKFTLDINLDSYEIGSNIMLMIGPNSILRFSKNNQDNVDAYILFMSIDFLKDINLDINTLNPRNFFERKNAPIMELSNEEAAILRRYLDMIHLNTTNNTDSVYIRNISRCLMASMIYQMMQFAASRKVEQEEDAPKQPQSRRLNYVRDFMSLVQKHHCLERSVGFYANKLFISPKYLSLIIKEVTGRSAAEWIDDYVILEAKNLLRFSGKNIQQVAYELNFSNQSSFGKYFKHLTGMSPTEFQRS